MDRDFAFERFAKVLEEIFQKHGAESLRKIEKEEFRMSEVLVDKMDSDIGDE